MALQTLANPQEYPSGLMGATGTLMNSSPMDTSGYAVAWVLNAPKAGDIAKVGILVNAAATPQALDVRVETIAADGTPSGTLWGSSSGFSTQGTIATPAANTWFWTTLDLAATVTRGQRFCVAVRFVSTVGNVRITESWNAALRSGIGAPYTLTKTGGSWFKETQQPLMAVEYSDGSRPFCGAVPASTNTPTNRAIASNTTPDEAGAYFQVPFACNVSGAMVKLATNSSTTYAIKLYDSDGSTVLASVTGIDGDQSSAGSGVTHTTLFSADVTLSPGVNYRITYLPEDTTGGNLYYATVDSAASAQSWPGGANWYWTERTDAGSWTQTTTRIPQMAIIISALDDGTDPVNLKVNPGLTGGLV